VEENGQIRLDEIYALTDNFNRPDKLINLFDAGVAFSGSFGIGGSIDFGLFDVSLSASDFGIPTSVSANLQLSDIIGSFTEVSLNTTPILATPVFQNGRRLLRINVGPHANARVHGDLSDGSDSVVVTGSNGALTVTVNGLSQLYTEPYSGIIAAGGSGENRLNFSGVSDLPVELYGGDGIDILTGGNSSNVIFGGGGNDTITGGGASDHLFGEGGNDSIFGGGGDDRILGGQGVDNLQGGAGNDIIEGGSGGDTLRGDDGNDVLRGQAGNDVLGQIGLETGDDLLEGGFGVDTLQQVETITTRFVAIEATILFEVGLVMIIFQAELGTTS
jgi:Ca2+-binding RTX toxin-like protein